MLLIFVYVANTMEKKATGVWLSECSHSLRVSWSSSLYKYQLFWWLKMKIQTIRTNHSLWESEKNPNSCWMSNWSRRQKLKRCRVRFHYPSWRVKSLAWFSLANNRSMSVGLSFATWHVSLDSFRKKVDCFFFLYSETQASTKPKPTVSVFSS